MAHTSQEPNLFSLVGYWKIMSLPPSIPLGPQVGSWGEKESQVPSARKSQLRGDADEMSMGLVREGFLELWAFEDGRCGSHLGQQHGRLLCWERPQHPLQLPLSWSCREKDSLAQSLQAAQKQAEELQQEREKLQATQEELQRQRDRLEEEREDTVQDSARTRRELERR